ncbi:hypothetical protein HOS33_gp277 [Erwinia phage vB_EamM_Y3]|uniref:Uncharacterized protein n=1 Tax=Erwinia phage vB_EamM_Y3 TaxID=1983553 RepID=A0A2H4IBI7_9CAUD|nr:hypothetical protein HOS33_gp277 [Erwinia phage vB_EamM_Y3]ARW58917.1 hypothetical protein Y3_277 [Erwinia phage vB_EamM_Y3]
MITFLLRALGLRYPSVYCALNNMRKDCVRISYDSYVVKNSSGLAEAINDYIKNTYDMVSPNDRDTASALRVNLLEGATNVHYPSVVWVTQSSLEILHVDYDQSDAYGA